MLGTQEAVFRFGDVEVREREFRLIKAGAVIPVEPKAFRVLLFLLHNPQKLITKEELLNAVWGETAVSENSLTRSIALLRRLLGEDTHEPRFIETVSTVGYRLICPVEIEESADASSRIQGTAASHQVAEVAPITPETRGNRGRSTTRNFCACHGNNDRARSSTASSLEVGSCGRDACCNPGSHGGRMVGMVVHARRAAYVTSIEAITHNGLAEGLSSDRWVSSLTSQRK